MPYAALIGKFAILQAQCVDVWPERLSQWGSIFTADLLRGILDTASYIRLMSLINSDYIALAQCIVGAQ